MTNEELIEKANAAIEPLIKPVMVYFEREVSGFERVYAAWTGDEEPTVDLLNESLEAGDDRLEIYDSLHQEVSGEEVLKILEIDGEAVDES